MNRLFFSLLFCFLNFLLIGQDTGNDSYTIQRLLIYNDKGEILLEKHKNGWMTPALRQHEKISINEGLKNLAAEFGLKISTPQLAGIFMFVPEYKNKSSQRQHYSCKVVEGELNIPEGKIDVQWFEPYKAIEMTTQYEINFCYQRYDKANH